MPNKNTPSQLSADTEPVDDAGISTSDLSPTPVVPATRRFRLVVALFGVWLLFLIYLAFLIWSGK